MAGGSIVLIPGIGADAGIYAPQREHFGDRLIVPPWVAPTSKRETLASYARRLGDAIRATPGLRRPFAVGGISFGGMLAAEVAEGDRSDVAAVLLIGACTRRTEVTRAFRLAALLGQIVPNGLAKGLLNRVVPEAFETLEGLRGPNRAIIDGVASRTDTRLLKWAALAVRRWEGALRPPVATFRAHGRLDRVIPLRGLPREAMRPGVDLVIPDGRHLIHLTHAAQVNRWIERVIG